MFGRILFRFKFLYNNNQNLDIWKEFKYFKSTLTLPELC